MKVLDKYYNEVGNTLSDIIYDKVLKYIQEYGPKYVGALIVILFGFIISYLLYRFVIYIFKRFKIIELIDKLTMTNYFGNKQHNPETKDAKKVEDIKKDILSFQKISDRIKIDVVTAKSVSYYIFLVFFRFAIVIIGIKEVEDFLLELINYLPSLFIAVVIGFFGIRFADFVYDVVYYTLEITSAKVSDILASGAKVIVLFFTLMIVLSKIGIAIFITNTILIGFVSMLTIAGGLAFGLGGKEIAKEILESFRKK